MQAQDINIEQLVESELNPRGSYDEASLAELAESLKSVGLLQPLTVRPVRGRSKKSKYEVVCGHRRLRAARLAGLTELACLVRELDDREAAFVALVENSQRQDVSPLDEAAAMRRLVDAGVPVEEIAARLARPVRFVQHRIQLTWLIEPVQELVKLGRMPLAGATRISSLTADMQTEIVESFSRYAADTVFSVSNVLGVIQQVTRSLANVPWDLDDSTLTPPAPACAACPQRTGAQGDLFEAGNDRCLDRKCFEEKKQAWLDGEVNAGVEVREGYVGPKSISADQVYVQTDEGYKPWRDEADEVPKVIYKTPDGRVQVAYDRAVLAPALREAGYQKDAAQIESRPGAAAAEADKEQAARNRKRAEAFNLEASALLEHSDLKLRVQEWGTEAMLLCELVPALVLMAIRACNNDAVRAVCSRREVKPVKDAYGRPDLVKPLRDHAKTLSVADQWKLFLELLAMAGGTYAPAYHGDTWPESWRTLREVAYGPTPATSAPNADVNADGEVIDEADQG